MGVAPHVFAEAVYQHHAPTRDRRHPVAHVQAQSIVGDWAVKKKGQDVVEGRQTQQTDPARPAGCPAKGGQDGACQDDTRVGHPEVSGPCCQVSWPPQRPGAISESGGLLARGGPAAFTGSVAAWKLASATSTACFGGLCTDSESVAAADGRLYQATTFSLPAGVLAVPDERVELFCVGELAFSDLGHFGVGAGSDVIDMAVVGRPPSADGCSSAVCRAIKLCVLTDSTEVVVSANFGRAVRATCRFNLTSFSTPSNALFVRPKSVSTLAWWLARTCSGSA